MEKVAKEVLKLLGNNHTKVEEKEEFKGNYYSYITDTIYLSKNNCISQKEKVELNISKETNSLVVMCHEAVHSVQNKLIHILNTFFSNLSIILSIMCIVMKFMSKESILLNIATLIGLAIAIIVRLVLETEAVNKSLEVAKRIVSEGIVENVRLQELEIAKEYIHKNKLVALLSMVLGKVLMFLTILVLTTI